MGETDSGFVDDDNDESIKNNYYYDAMERLDGEKARAKEALKLLEAALEMDEDYVQTYIGLISVYSILGKKEKAEEMIKVAYEKTLKKFPKWPKNMEWGDMDNRAYLRAIQHMADLYWDNGENDKAIELFRLLLKLNPNDNQGVRYEIAGLYAGLKGTDINKMFDEGNKNQDWSALEKLEAEQNKKHTFSKGYQEKKQFFFIRTPNTALI